MKTDVFDDILCLCIGDDLTTFRNEFSAIIEILNQGDVSYFLTGSAAVSEYVNPFATTELDIQLLTHSVADVANLLEPLNLDLTLDNNQLLIKSREPLNLHLDFFIYVLQSVPFASQHYQPGSFATVLGVEQVPVADIQTLIWYQLRWMFDGGRYDRLQYKVYLKQLLESEKVTLSTTRGWLKANADAELIQLFESTISELELGKLKPALTWGELQARKRRLRDEIVKATER